MFATVRHTVPPGKYVVLYDGHCRFCTQGSHRLASLMRWAKVELVDFQVPGILEAFPGITHDACMERLHLVRPDGRVFAGVEAIVHALATLPLIGRLAFICYLPGLRQLLDRLYKIIAEHRYRILGRAIASGACEEGTCALHLGKPSHEPSNGLGRRSGVDRSTPT